MERNKNSVSGDATPFVKLSGQLGDAVRRDRDNLVGKLLTLVEAVARDEEQRKALKSLVRNAVWGSPRIALSVEIDEIMDDFTEVYEDKRIEKTNMSGGRNKTRVGMPSYFKK